jgi:hypothetical protein
MLNTSLHYTLLDHTLELQNGRKFPGGVLALIKLWFKPLEKRSLPPLAMRTELYKAIVQLQDENVQDCASRMRVGLGCVCVLCVCWVHPSVGVRCLGS